MLSITSDSLVFTIGSDSDGPAGVANVFIELNLAYVAFSVVGNS